MIYKIVYFDETFSHVKHVKHQRRSKFVQILQSPPNRDPNSDDSRRRVRAFGSLFGCSCCCRQIFAEGKTLSPESAAASTHNPRSSSCSNKHKRTARVCRVWNCVSIRFSTFRQTKEFSLVRGSCVVPCVCVGQISPKCVVKWWKLVEFGGQCPAGKVAGKFRSGKSAPILDKQDSILRLATLINVWK